MPSIEKRVMKRLEQKGGSCFKPGKSVSTMVKQMTCGIKYMVSGVENGVKGAVSIIELPHDLSSIASRPNEPSPFSVQLNEDFSYL